MLAVLLILAPVIVFLTSVVPTNEWWSYVIVCVLACGAFLMHWFAVTCDPGIIPPAPSGSPDVQPGKITLADGTEIDEKVCASCNIVRPPKSSHCVNCDYCVQEYDHHCGVLGSCVARRTFRFFTLYFYFLVPLSLFVLIRSIVVLATTDYRSSLLHEGHYGRWKVVAAAGCVLYGGCASCGVIMQLGMYTDLACKNETTKIQTQSRRLKLPPHQRGGSTVVYATDVDPEHSTRSCGSCLHRLFGPLEPSRVISTADVV